MKISPFIALLILLLFASCAGVFSKKQIRVFNKDNPINTQSSFYLNYPKNGFQKALIANKLETNPDSAREVVDTIRNGLSEKMGHLTIIAVNA